jgi:hypothetical protein
MSGKQEETHMKDIIELEGRKYHYSRVVCQKLGIDPKTLRAWVENGSVPKPVVFGRRNFHDLALLERRALANAQ